jgi:site-specific DNA recombinase
MKKKGKRKSNGKECLFAHIAKCADCQSGMHYKSDRRNGAYVCGGYVKFSSSFCSSHIIEEQTLLQMVKNDLRTIIKDNISTDRFYGIAEEKVNTLLSSTKKELIQIEKQLNELDKLFNKLLNLHIDGTITTEQFRQ